MSVRLFSIAASLAALVSVAFGSVSSGLKTGEMVNAFQPYHVTGPDQGTQTCPVCKYGMEPAVQVWVNGDNMANVANLADNLEAQIGKYGLKKLRVFFVFLKPADKSSEAFAKQLKDLATTHHLDRVALTMISDPSHPAIGDYGINTSTAMRNTVMVYVNRQVTRNSVNLVADAANLSTLDAAVKSAVAGYR